MDKDEILAVVGKNNHPIALGGTYSDNVDVECGINKIIIFDGKDIPEKIIKNESKIFKIQHENLYEKNFEKFLYFENLQIIQDEQWDLKMLLSKIKEKKDSIFITSAKNSIVDAQFALSKAKNILNDNDPFLSCWIKCASISLIDSILYQNKILPNHTVTLNSIRNLKDKNSNQFSDKIISELGVERSTPSLLSRMLKSTSGFSDMVEKNQNSSIIEKKANYLVTNSLLSDCYIFLCYQNKNNFYQIKDSLNKNSDKIHVLKVGFDLSNDVSKNSKSIESLYDISNSLLTSFH
mgnify:CR=1 FL=1|tara:strand:+ start:37 stop:915 length:879 start_codon:yes stop_codon:yes gene_type:complete